MLLALLACASEPFGAPQLVDTEPYLYGEVLVRVVGDDVAQMRVEDAHGVAEVERYDGIAVVKVGFELERPVREVVDALAADPLVEFVEPNHMVRGLGTSVNDPYAGYQWNLDAIGASTAWQTSTGKGITVAVLDTGVRSGGPDGLTTLLSGYDYYNGDSNPTDGNGHGTFVAGTIGQKTNNGKGVAGEAAQPVAGKWICKLCSMIYDPTAGDPDSGIAPGTPFEAIPDDWRCPICGARKASFVPYREPELLAVA